MVQSDIARTISFLREEFKRIVYLLKHFIVAEVWTWFWDLRQYFSAMPISTAISIILEKNYCKHSSVFWRTVNFIDDVAPQCHSRNFPEFGSGSHRARSYIIGCLCIESAISSAISKMKKKVLEGFRSFW